MKELEILTRVSATCCNEKARCFVDDVGPSREKHLAFEVHGLIEGLKRQDAYCLHDMPLPKKQQGT